MELNRLIESRLSDYPRTLEGDKNTYDHDADQLNQAQLYGLLITIEEKTNLHFMLDPLTRLIEYLTMKPADAIEAMKADRELPSTAKKYLNDVLIPLVESEIQKN